MKLISSPVISIIYFIFTALSSQLCAARSGSRFDIDEKEALLQELSGNRLRMSASPDPPWLNERLEANGTVTFYGFHVDICDYLAEGLNISYSFIRIHKDEEEKYGRKEASLKLLYRGVVDVATKFIRLDINQCTQVDCSTPFFTLKSQMMVPWPNEESRILAPIRPYKTEIWLLWMISMICVGFLMIWLQKIYKKRENERNPTDVGIIAIYMLTAEGNWNKWRYKISFRTIQGFWCLASFVLVYAYSTTLISYLTAPKLMPVSKTFKDLATGSPQNLKILSEKDGLLASFCLKTTLEPFKTLGDSFKRYPESLFLDSMEGFQKLSTGKYGYVGADVQVISFMNTAFKKADIHCKFTVSNTDIVAISNKLVWAFPKDWRYAELVNHRLDGLAEWGLINYWLNKNMPSKLDQCQLEKYQLLSSKLRPLSLNDLSGPFIFLCAGCMISFLVFLLEMIFKYRRIRIAA